MGKKMYFMMEKEGTKKDKKGGFKSISVRGATYEQLKEIASLLARRHCMLEENVSYCAALDFTIQNMLRILRNDIVFSPSAFIPSVTECITKRRKSRTEEKSTVESI